MIKEQLDIIGMTCSACAAKIEKSVAKVEGTEQISVNLLKNSMSLSYDEAKTSTAEIINVIKKSGYDAKQKNKKKELVEAENADVAAYKNMKQRLGVSFLFSIPLFYISMGHMLGWPLPNILMGAENAISFALTQLLLLLPVIYVNMKYFKGGFTSLLRGSPNMDSLIAIGSSAATFYGIFAIYKIGYGLGHGDLMLVHHFSMDLYFESAAIILTLITLGKFFEARAKGKTSEAITKLMNLIPKTATILRDGVESVIAIEDVSKHDILIVKAGETIPVDGQLIEGSSSVDEAAITGESIPVEKIVGSKVIGATINKSGYFKMEALKVGDDTTLSQIVKLVDEATSSKAPIAKMADRVSGIFVPVVFGVSIVSFITWMLLGYSLEFSLSIAIAVLVISCPCALGLATPTAIMVGTGKGAENGILIKSAVALEMAHNIDIVVMDKTGTVTEGKPVVTDIVVAGSIKETVFLAIARALESKSEHPLADAIMQKANSEEVEELHMFDFEQLAGMGIAATYQEERYYAGNQRLMKHIGIAKHSLLTDGEKLAEDGKTPLYFARGSEMLGVIAVADTVKPTSKQAIEELTSMGIEVIMLTGDNAKTAEAIRKKIGLKKVIAEVFPQDKEKEIRNLQANGKKVAMIGDGINDAPALARADVGIAIGAGTDIAIESADIVLMKSDLLDAVTAIQLSKAVIRNIKQNLFWAFFYNTIGIPVAAGVFYISLGWLLNPMIGAAAMSFSSVSVVLNALRLKLFTPKRMIMKKEVTKETAQPSKEKTKMNKKIKIEGMSCGHCKASVEKALLGVAGVQSAIVNLGEKEANVEVLDNVNNTMLKDVVMEAGYEVIEVIG